jgi:uncharacterized protein with LGFP repeats
MGAVMSRLLGSPTFLTSAALVLLAGTFAALPATAQPAAPAADQRIRLSAPAGDVVRSATVDLAGRTWARTARGATRTLTLRADRFSMVGATWAGSAPELEVRTQQAGGWTRWRHADPMADANGASELLWVGDSRAIQVRATGVPRDLDLVLIDPGRLPGDRSGVPAAASSPLRARPTSAPAPRLHTRKQWGANNKWRNGKPTYNRTVKQVHVHHTATGNRYKRVDVPGIIRGMYRYHTKTLGWFDIGYNFLVDKFGRAWVGRSGGVNRVVQGAHTLGFNKRTVGIAVIGNLEERRPWPEARATVAKLAAWKLDRYDRVAKDTTVMRSTGSDKYPDGRRVRLPVIDGHRDTNDTACPGEYLYAQLPAIRNRAQRRINRW